MNTWKLRLGLSLVAAVGVGMDRLAAQEMVQPAKQVVVAPAVAYEPAHPSSDANAGSLPPSLIKLVDFKAPSDAPPPEAPPVDFKGNGTVPIPRIWTRAEYLLWWVREAPLPIPIVTTGDPNNGFPTLNTAGAIGQPATQVLLGNQTLDFGPFSGMRFTVGGWVDDDRTIGVEVNAFMLERRAYNFAAASDPTGNNPPLYFPRYNPSVGFEDAVPIADPLRGYSGSVSAYSTLQLWGAEANGIWNVVRQPGLEFSLLAGFRNANLTESFQINSATTDLANGNLTTTNDSFGTDNHFYGGQVGAQLVLENHGFSLDVAAKLALGATQQTVDIGGSSAQFGPNALAPPGVGVFPGGFFAQPSNVGRRSTTEFTVLPSVELNLSYQITQELRVFVGYTFMYWNQVVRPGNQIDHSVNTTQNAILSPTGVGMLVGPATPAPLFNRTDFWAQGLNFGLEFRF